MFCTCTHAIPHRLLQLLVAIMLYSTHSNLLFIQEMRWVWLEDGCGSLFSPQVVVIEPFFDCYAPMTKMAGGVLKPVPLRPVSVS